MPTNPTPEDDAALVTRLLDLHQRMLNAAQKQRPYPVKMACNEDDAGAILDACIRLERIAARLSAAPAQGEVTEARLARAIQDVGDEIGATEAQRIALRYAEAAVRSELRAMQSAAEAPAAPDALREALERSISNRVVCDGGDRPRWHVTFDFRNGDDAHDFFAALAIPADGGSEADGDGE